MIFSYRIKITFFLFSTCSFLTQVRPIQLIEAKKKKELIVGSIGTWQNIFFWFPVDNLLSLFFLAYLFQSGIYKEYNMLSKGQFQLNQHIFSISVQSVTPLQNNPPNLLIPYNTLFFMIRTFISVTKVDVWIWRPHLIGDLAIFFLYTCIYVKKRKI